MTIKALSMRLISLQIGWTNATTLLKKNIYV